MLLRSILCLGTSLILTMGTSAQAEETTPAGTVVATVNGVNITLGHLALARAELPDQYQQMPPNVLYDGLLEQLIQQSLLAQSLEEVSELMAVRVENSRRAIIANEALNLLIAAALTDEAIQAAYEAKYANAEPQKEFNASHILVETEEQALNLQQLASDGDDFADLAREHSTGPSGPNGGELGWFGAGQMVPPFEEAVMAMEPETVSAPVQTQFGWHIIRLNDARNTAAPALVEVRGEIASELETAEIQNILANLSDGAEVTKVDGINQDLIADPTIFDE